MPGVFTVSEHPDEPRAWLVQAAKTSAAHTREYIADLRGVDDE